MSRLVATLLREFGDEAYRKVIALKCVMLPDILRDRGEGGAAAADRMEEALAPLDGLGADVLVDEGTPFFWFNVQRFYFEPAATPERLLECVRHLAMTAFDAYFHRLPDGARFEIAPVEGSDLILPRLGIRLPSPAKPVSLIRQGADCVRIETGGEALEARIGEVDERLRQPRLPIPRYSDTWLLLAQDRAIFKETFSGKIAPGTPAAPGLSVMIGDSLDMIRRVLPSVGERLPKLVKWYVPLSTPSLQIHNSFTTPHLVGVIFLSEAYSDIRLAEAMVHEFHHAELHKLMEAEDVVEYREDELFYSPWRPDPRPLYGLLHGLHVFTGVADFYALLEAHKDSPETVETCRERRREVCFKVRLGLAQVRKEALAERGREILASIENELREHEADLGMERDEYPSGIREHLHAWVERNPGLASGVRMP